MNQMFLIVAYDIASDRRRNRVAHFLKDYGHRVNYSVFECRIQRVQYSKLRSGLKKLIHRKKDSILLYDLCRNCELRKDSLGFRNVPDDPPIVMV